MIKLKIVPIGAAVICCAFAAGCAQKPEAIAPAYVSPTTYQDWDCTQLKAEAVRLDAALNQASATQNKARQNDTVGVILLGLPVSSLSGGNVADQIAFLKGNKDTIQQTQIGRRCIVVVPAPAA